MATDPLADLGAAVVDTFAIEVPAHVALVGAGGKTTLLRAIGQCLQARGARVLLTTTTKMGTSQVDALPGFGAHRVVGTKVLGPTPEAVDRAFASGDFDAVVVEADGARHHLVKSPAAHEPVVPGSATLVIAVVGAGALDRVIEDVAHRPLRVAGVAGCRSYDRLTPERAARVLLSVRGLRKGVPPGARYAVAVNRTGPDERASAEALAVLVAAAGVPVVVLPLLPALVDL